MKILFIALTLILSAGASAQECDFRLVLPIGFVQPGQSAQTLQQQYTIERRVNANGPCSRYLLYFGKGFANSYQRAASNIYGQSTNYNLHSNINLSGVLKDRNDALNSEEFIAGNTQNNNTEYTGSFFLSVPALSSSVNTRAGLYFDLVEVAIYRVQASNASFFEKTQNYSVYILIPAKLNVSLVSEGDAFNVNSTNKTLDFGTLEANEELGADIIVDSNTPYQLRMASLNNGKLMKGTSGINYQMRVNNSNVDLSNSSSSAVTIGSGNGPTPVTGTRFNAKVKILTLPVNPPTGVYTDSITITAIAN